MRIPVCEPLLIDKEKRYVIDCLETNWISSAGKYITSLEEGFSKYCGVSYGAACTNGTTALHLAIRALDIKAGDEVILPSFTMMASLLPILYERATPIFVDAEPDTWNMNPHTIEALITPKTKAIMVVHIYGHSVDMDPIRAIAQKYHLKIIEDAAEAHGALYKNQKVGALGDIACFSFYANKLITSGEGGIVVSPNESLINACKYYRNLAFDSDPEKRFIHEDIGYNYRMTNIQAAIAYAQLEHIEALIERRRRNAKLYTDTLSSLDWLALPVEKSWARNVYWMYGVVLKDNAPFSMHEIREKLKSKGIDTRRFFFPLHKQPVLKKLGLDHQPNLPISEALWEKGFYLPSGSGLTEDQIAYVCDALKSLSL